MDYWLTASGFPTPAGAAVLIFVEGDPIEWNRFKGLCPEGRAIRLGMADFYPFPSGHTKNLSAAARCWLNQRPMTCRCALLALLVLYGGRLIAGDVDETRPYGRACATVIDSNGKSEAVLDGEVRAVAGNEMTLHFEANREGEALVALLTKKDGALAHGWRPLMLPIGEWDAHIAPVPPEKWTFPADDEAFEVFVVFFPKAAPAANEVRGLVTKLRDPNADAAALLAGARQLRETLQKWQVAETAMDAAPESAPAAVGGTLRDAGSDFPWRTFAKRANFSADKPAVIVFGHAVGK